MVVTINMSLLRSWPNPAHALDGWIPSLLDAGHDRPAASDEQGWAGGGATAKAHQPQRGDMFIARPNRNLRKPRRGDMVLSRTGHAAYVKLNIIGMNGVLAPHRPLAVTE